MSRKPVTYRDLRNTPGRVFERLARGEPLPLVAEGETKAILLPVEGGDTTTVLEAWRRGRALLALARLQEASRRSNTSRLGIEDIDREVAAARKARRKSERSR